MSITTKKSKKQVLGYFKSEKKALEFVEHFKFYNLKKGCHYTFFVVNKQRTKEGKKPWLAYALYEKIKVS